MVTKNLQKQKGTIFQSDIKKNEKFFWLCMYFVGVSLETLKTP